MAKTKLKRFAENATFSHLIQQERGIYPLPDHPFKGKWNQNFFKREAPLILELACGRGEYTVNLSRLYPEKNFIGIDWKGARLWRGAKTIQEENLSNAAFLRIQILNILSYFGPNEADEIWITFPDPQLQQSREQKRLTSDRFLDLYRKFMKPGGVIHLKTDSRVLYEYTLEVIRANNLKIMDQTDDLYASGLPDEVLSIKTTYEKIWLKEGLKICYLKYKI
jgi:tRNA (guanine-N7-)-methyltransferase